MSDNDLLAFEYRLPTTLVRVSGTATTTLDTLTADTLKEVKALATTVVAADIRTRLMARLSVDSQGKVEQNLKLTPDGRLKNVTITSTVSRLGILPTAARVGTFALAAAMPLLIPGPAGWLASLSALAVSRKRPPGRSDVDADYGVTKEELVLDAYKAAGYDEAILVGLRRSMTVASRAQATALATEEIKAGQVDVLVRATRAANRLRPALDRAEAEFRTWRATTMKVTVEEFDQHFRIEQLPSEQTLREWVVSDGDAGTWGDFTRQWDVAVSADLVKSVPDETLPTVAKPPKMFEPLPENDELWWRSPRRVSLKVWRVREADAGRTLELVTETTVDTPWPGNEKTLSLNAKGNSGKLAYSFDETGALIEVGAELTGTGRQVSGELDSLMTGLSDAADAGTKLRQAFAPPSLKEQVEAKEALAKLAPAEEDPTKAEERKKLEAAQYRAQLRIAEQLAEATSPPQFVVFSTTS